MKKILIKNKIIFKFTTSWLFYTFLKSSLKNCMCDFTSECFNKDAKINEDIDLLGISIG